MSRTVAIIPALDEEACIGEVVRGIVPRVNVVVVVDNGSTDGTAARARAAGADVVSEPHRGYGRACLAGLQRARALEAGVALFLDADGSDDPGESFKLIEPVCSGEVDIALGRRPKALIEPGAMTSVQRFGNWFAPLLMRLTLGATYSDMPPFKACSMTAIDRLDLRDEGHGFTIELLVKAHAARLRVKEVDVSCRARRGGESKVSGTLVGASRAAAKIVSTIGRHAASAHARSLMARVRSS
jgi:glycosyltransferase involved in cell wall biosynthesis